MSSGGSWKDAATAQAFLEGRRGAIPYAADQLRMMAQLVAHFAPRPVRVLDLGCGDGLLARVILDEWPECRALLLDHSFAMLDRARVAMSQYEGRFELAEADLSANLTVEGPFDVVVSGFAIHHLPHERKRELYGEIHSLLRPGGLFVNVEHVAAATAEGEALFDQLYIHELASKSGRPVEQVSQEYHSRPDKADNILLDVETQLGWLRELGFKQADCYFKWLELAVFGGVRGD